MILDPKTGKPARIGYKKNEKGEKIRISKISGEEVKAVKGKKEPKKATKTTDATKVTEVQKDAKDGSPVPAKKGPFWKRMGFSAGEDKDADVKEAAHSQQDHTIPSQQLHSRSAGRGS